MNRILATAAILLFLVAGCAHSDEKKAVARVLAARLEALHQASRIERRAGENCVLVNQGKFFNGCKNIDLAGCPSKFRLAWQDYLAAWKKKRQEEDLLLLHIAGAVMPPHVSLLHKAKSAAAMNDRERADSDSAWRQVERAALDLGIDAEKPISEVLPQP